MSTTHTSTYRAAVIREPAGPDSVTIIDRTPTSPAAGQVRVRVHAGAVNPVDAFVTAGVFHEAGVITQPEFTGLGWDFAGTVSEAGPGVELAIGTRVAGLVPGLDRDFGAFSQELTIDTETLSAVPDGLGFEAAATIPLNALTAVQILDLLGDPRDGEDRLLVTGAAGAVGTNVALLAPERGWQVTGLARSADAAFIRHLGVVFTDSAAGGWPAVADAAGMQEAARSLVADGGRLVGVLPGQPVAAERGITVTAVSVEPDAGTLAGLLERAADGRLPTRIHAVIDLDALPQALAAVAGGGVRGRYVVKL